jgi:hypothetical protein
MGWSMKNDDDTGSWIHEEDLDGGEGKKEKEEVEW